MTDESRFVVFRISSRPYYSGPGWYFESVVFYCETGDGPFRVRSENGSLPMGLCDGVDYWTISLGRGMFRLATSKLNAFNDINVEITAPGSGCWLIGPSEGSK